MLRVLCIWIVVAYSALYAFEVGDIVTNTAYADYTVKGVSERSASNTVRLKVEGTEAIIYFLRPVDSGAEAYPIPQTFFKDDSNATYQVPPPAKGEFSPGDTLNLIESERYDTGSNAIILLEDPDQNLDNAKRESVWVRVVSPTGDFEEVLLLETKPDSGKFTGYIPLGENLTAVQDGVLWIRGGEKAEARYVDNGTILKRDVALILPPLKDLKVWITKEVDKSSASLGEVLRYTLTVHSDEPYEITNLRVRDQMSLGLEMLEGSLKKEGQKHTYRLDESKRGFDTEVGRLPANGTVRFSYYAVIVPGFASNRVINRAFTYDASYRYGAKYLNQNGTIAAGDTPQGFVSNTAEATTRLNEELLRSKGTILGQVYECSGGVEYRKRGVFGVRLYMEDGTYVVTDRKGRYHFEGVEKGTHVVQIDTALLPEGYTLYDGNVSGLHAGRRYSQFVLMQEGLVKRVDFCLKPTGQRGVVKLNDRLTPQTHTKDIFSYAPKQNHKPPAFNDALLQRYQNKNEIVWPPKRYIPPVPSVDIAFVHDRHLDFKVYLNGIEVNKIHYEGKVGDKNATTWLQRFKGIDLLPERNVLVVALRDKSGKVVKKLKRIIYVSQTPVRAEVLKERSRLIADGKTPPVIAVRFYDAQGELLRSGITGTYRIEEPYRSLQKLEQLRNDPLALHQGLDNRYIIDSEGIAYIKLQPTTESGMVTLHFQLMGRDEPLYVWLRPALREWIMVGFVEGSVGYNTLSGNKENLKEADAVEKVITEGRAKFFAKGKVLGKWLLTLAYDSGKNVDEETLYRYIDPNRYYTLYQDATIQNYEAQSRKKLYIKIEQEAFSVLFGDFSTDLSVTQLSRYSRRLNGLKAEYHDERFGLKAFVSQSEQVHTRQEIRADGTSGYYQLQHTPVVQHSEKVTIEVRDRYRPNVVLSKETLQRFRDYEIDYERGTLYFKQAIYSTDERFNPRFIVVDYETKSESIENLTYGGRASLQVSSGLQAGVSYIHEENGLSQTRLGGLDVTWRVGKSTRIQAEVARSIGTIEGNSTRGDAKFFEIEHFAKSYYVRGYYQEQDHSFGLGQLSPLLGGMRYYGIGLRKTFENRLVWSLDLFRNEELKSKQKQDVFENRLEIQRTFWSAYMGYRYAKEGASPAINQLLLGGEYRLFDQRLRLMASHDQTFGSNSNTLFPTRTRVGVDFALKQNMSIFGSYEWLDSDAGASRLGRVGLRYMPWSGMTIENTTLSEFSNDITRLYNTLGLLQQYQWGKWSFSFGYEKGRLLEGNETISSGSLGGAQGGVDFSAYRLGIHYRTGEWSAYANGEYRISDLEEKYNATMGVYTQVDSALAFALGGRWHKISALNEQDESASLRLSMAYRDDESSIVVLDKLELRHEKHTALAEEMLTQKIINNLSVHHRFSKKSEVAIQYGTKYVSNSNLEYDYRGWTHFLGVDLQWNLSPKWMLGLQGSLLYAKSANKYDYGLGVYGAYMFQTNMMAVAGYNVKGYEDRDFSLQNYRIQGPYIQLRMKIDQDNLKETARWLSW